MPAISTGSARRENPDDEWRAYLDVDDDLPVFCPECAGREFERPGLLDH